MSHESNGLPVLGDALFLTDGGLETTLVFHHGMELPCFAAFSLLRTEEGTETLRAYFRSYVELARRFEVGILLDTPTWRASRDWGERLGYTVDELAEANRRAVSLLEEFRGGDAPPRPGIVISGCIGPRGDGYSPRDAMSAAEAERYHSEQIGVLADTGVDLLTALTLNQSEEAVGVALAAKRVGAPIAVSFTVETDGRLPSGQPLGEAIERVDEETSGYPAYFMINCAHPTHFRGIFEDGASWVGRLRGLRANASRMSHAELDEAPELDEGDPVELGEQFAELRRSVLPHLNILGGCCGTDCRHIERIAASCVPEFRS